MALKYCFEQKYVQRTLKNCKKNDLAVIDTDGIDPAIIKNAITRGVYIYGYLNVGALEKERSYYSKFKHLRLAEYNGWAGEYWVDVTDKEWQRHLINEAIKMKKLGVIGLYFDNADIYYMCKEGFKEEDTDMMQKAPSANNVYKALAHIILTIQNDVGLIVMPNGGDVFLRKFMVAHPNVIKTINQEGVFYSELNKKNKSADTKYYKDWCKWADKRIIGKARLIEYVSSKTEQARIKAYCFAKGWDVYFSKHKNLCGD